MLVIENFAALSFKEQREFAETLLKTINSEHTFTSDTQFELAGIEADDLTGGLTIMVSHTDLIKVNRDATWTCDDAEDATEDPGFEADYENSIIEDAKKAFKTLDTVIDGYKVSLEISDVDANDAIEVAVNNISHEDAGIGDYEYWGARGHDSSPYVEVQGTIVKECDCSLAFFVEPADNVPEEN